MTPITPQDLQKITHNNKITFSIQLNTDTKPLVCTEILRLVPGNRIVCKAKFQSKDVIAKFFISTAHATRHIRREVNGINSLRDAGIAIPEIVHKASLSNGAQVLITEYLQDAIAPSVFFKGKTERKVQKKILEKIFKLLAQFHKAGLAQNDLHLDNFLLKGNMLYAIDAANTKKTVAPMPSAAVIENLSFFITQFQQNLVPLILDALPAYNHESPTVLIPQKTLFTQIQKKRIKTWNRFAKKIFRNCTGIVAAKTFNRFTLCKREYYDGLFVDFLNNPDITNKNTKLLKKGDGSTVISIEIRDRKFVVKQYNIKNPLNFICRQLQPSRARKNWLYAHLLCFYGISTPKPIAMLERRFGPFKLKSYFITEYIDAQNVQYSFEQAKDSPKEQHEILTRFAQSLKTLASHNISHGNFKASNFLDTLPTTSIVDLDNMSCHRSRLFFEKDYRKDRLRFLKNFHANTNLKKQAISILNS